MSDTKDGGPAFPFPIRDRRGDVVDVHPGMSLRDYFAGQAVQWILANDDAWVDYPDVAKSAYAIADAMITARSAGPEGGKP